MFNGFRAAVPRSLSCHSQLSNRPGLPGSVNLNHFFCVQLHVKRKRKCKCNCTPRAAACTPCDSQHKFQTSGTDRQFRLLKSRSPGKIINDCAAGRRGSIFFSNLLTIRRAKAHFFRRTTCRYQELDPPTNQSRSGSLCLEIMERQRRRQGPCPMSCCPSSGRTWP